MTTSIQAMVGNSSAAWEGWNGLGYEARTQILERWTEELQPELRARHPHPHRTEDVRAGGRRPERRWLARRGQHLPGRPGRRHGQRWSAAALG